MKGWKGCSNILSTLPAYITEQQFFYASVPYTTGGGQQFLAPIRLLMLFLIIVWFHHWLLGNGKVKENVKEWPDIRTVPFTKQSLFLCNLSVRQSVMTYISCNVFTVKLLHLFSFYLFLFFCYINCIALSYVRRLSVLNIFVCITSKVAMQLSWQSSPALAMLSLFTWLSGLGEMDRIMPWDTNVIRETDADHWYNCFVAMF